MARGEPWLGSLPEGAAPSGPAAHLWLAKAGRLTAGALTLVALIFGLWSRRNLRNRAHPFTAFDVGVATLVPLGALMAVVAAPLLLIRADDLRTALLFVTLLGFCGVATWVVRAELHWLRNPANRTSLSTVRHRGAAWLILWLTAMVWVSAPTVVRMSAAAELPTLRPAAAFVGQSAAAVLTALGPPEAISCSTSSQEWTYRTTKAEPIVALTLSGDHVVASSGDAAPLVPRRAELRSPYLGERAGEAGRKLQLGAPVTTAQGPATELTYADGLVLTVHAGRIVSISKR